MKTQQSDQDYIREVVCRVIATDSEDESILLDISGDSFESEVRRAAVDGIIETTFDNNFMNFIKSMRIADITAAQAATAVSVMSALSDRNNKTGG